MKDKIEYEILEDGTISIKTTAVSPTNHVSADQLLSEIHKLAGGERTSKKRMDILPGMKLHDALHAHNHDHHTH